MVKTLACSLGGGYVAVADDGDMYAWVGLDLTYECPVGLSLIHLGACTSVYGECLYAYVLES